MKYKEFCRLLIDNEVLNTLAEHIPALAGKHNNKSEIAYELIKLLNIQNVRDYAAGIVTGTLIAGYYIRNKPIETMVELNEIWESIEKDKRRLIEDE